MELVQKVLLFFFPSFCRYHRGNWFLKGAYIQMMENSKVLPGCLFIAEETAHTTEAEYYLLTAFEWLESQIMLQTLNRVIYNDENALR